MDAVRDSRMVSIGQRFLRLESVVEISTVAVHAKIQRVAHHLVGDGRMHYEKHFCPKLMSFGPIHYGVPKLRIGEQYKEMWAAMYIRSTGQHPRSLYHRIADNIHDLKELFADDLFTSECSGQGFTDDEEMVCWLLFVDGCALLQILEQGWLGQPQVMKVKIEQLALVMQDVLLLENQLPYLLLKLLWRNMDQWSLLRTINHFLRFNYWSELIGDLMPPTHLLDLHRSIYLYDPFRLIEVSPHVLYEETIGTYRNIMELKAAGIELKSSKTRRPRDISFSAGWLRSKLTLPEIFVDETTATKILNLIAYEMCPDFVNDYGVCAYVSFLNSLINHPDDVKALRSEQILFNTLGSDEEVVNLWTTLSSYFFPDQTKYFGVRMEIERHYRHKTLRTWFALGYNTYFSNPWSTIAFLAAVLGLALTVIQTWCAIHSPK